MVGLVPTIPASSGTTVAANQHAPLPDARWILGTSPRMTAIAFIKALKMEE